MLPKKIKQKKVCMLIILWEVKLRRTEERGSVYPGQIIIIKNLQ